jgi:hypothetical protein
MRHVDVDRSAARFLGSPEAFGELRPDRTPAQLLTQIFRVISRIDGHALGALTGAAALAPIRWSLAYS